MRISIIKNRVLEPLDTSKKPILYDAYYQDSGLAKPVVIFCHGYKGFKDWGAWHLVAEAFSKAGFFFLKFNFSHNGGTISQPIDFPDLEAFAQNNYSKELDDVARVLDLVTNKNSFDTEVDFSKIYLIGHSRGGGIVLIKGQEDRRVTCVVTWAGVSDFKVRFQERTPAFERFRKEGRYYVENGRTKQQMPHDWQFYTNFIAHQERLCIKRAVQDIKKPMLIVHGENDCAVLLEEAEILHFWNPNSELYIVPQANHVFGASHPYLDVHVPKPLAAVIDKTISFLAD